MSTAPKTYKISQLDKIRLADVDENDLLIISDVDAKNSLKQKSITIKTLMEYIAKNSDEISRDIMDPGSKINNAISEVVNNIATIQQWENQSESGMEETDFIIDCGGEDYGKETA